MRKIMILSLVFILSNDLFAWDCGRPTIPKCGEEKLYKLVESKSLLVSEGRRLSYKNTLGDTNQITFSDGKYENKIKLISSGEELKAETKEKIKNTTDFYAVFDNVTCLENRRILKTYKDQPLQNVYFNFNKTAVWPKIKCNPDAPKLIEKNYNKKEKLTNAAELKKYGYFIVDQKDTIWRYATYPSYIIVVDVKNNLCKQKLCNQKKNMPITELKAVDDLMFDDDNKIYYPL